jgi:hypothetical protein
MAHESSSEGRRRTGSNATNVADPTGGRTLLRPGRARSGSWAESEALPQSESALRLFNGSDFSGWSGQVTKHWAAVEGCIRGSNDSPMPVSTYLFTDKPYRNLRLLFEAKQAVGRGYNPSMHSAVAILGERITDREEPYGFKGLLLMFCGDWGIWDAHGRNRIYPADQPQDVMWSHPSEDVGGWNRIELLVVGSRIQMANNGQLVVDYTEKTRRLGASPLGLQLHSNSAPQKYFFRGLVLTENPEGHLLTVAANPPRSRLSRRSVQAKADPRL